ncbi:hypothetical protein ACP275_12G070700 [Erythranthe tilingii]
MSDYPCVNVCDYHGVNYKTRWPELVGMPAPQCEATIKRDNPFVTSIINLVPTDEGVNPNYCCNRVYLFLDQNDLCIAVPKVG